MKKLEAGGSRRDRRARRRAGEGRPPAGRSCRRSSSTSTSSTAANWRAYVDQLTAAGVTAPAAAQLRDPAVGSARRAGTGRGPERGSAARRRPAARQPTSLLVLPAETLERGERRDGCARAPLRARAPPARSRGTAARWSSRVRSRGLSLPGDQAELFAVTARSHRPTCCPATWSSSATRVRSRPRGHRAGPEDDARRRRPGRRGRRAHAPGRRGARHRPAEPRPAGAGDGARDRRAARCGSSAATPSIRRATTARGTGAAIPNGLIPPSAMCPIGVGSHQLRCDAAAAFRAMSAAFASSFGGADLHHRLLPHLRQPGAALRARSRPSRPCRGPATTAGVSRSTSAAASRRSAPRPTPGWSPTPAGSGSCTPTWADPGDGREEPWHWEYAGT